MARPKKFTKRRMRQFLELLHNGHTIKDICAELAISSSTYRMARLANPGFAEQVDSLKHLREMPTRTGRRPPWREGGPRTSVVYFVRRKSDGLIKIGYTHYLRIRLCMIERNHGDIDFLGLMSGAREKEAKLHARFDKARVEGEYFEPSPQLRHFIEEHTSIPRAWK